MTATQRFPSITLPTLVAVCPTYKKALDAFQAALEHQDEAALELAWRDATIAASAFKQGVEFALQTGRA